MMNIEKWLSAITRRPALDLWLLATKEPQEVATSDQRRAQTVYRVHADNH
jgi:hypothetical protein